MKKRNLKSLKINKQKVSEFKVTTIKGGDNTKWVMAATYYCCIRYK